ncbi:protein of unknown function [Methylacidimicrobium sp. AP8]|nr:protein of unknown function [Methylacidimicrobium sp. AP8]
MYVQEVRTCQRGKVYRSVLVRESYRVGKQVKTRILSNLTRMPVEVQQAVRALLQGKKLVPLDGLEGQEALDYGGLAVLEQAWQRFGLDQVLSGVGSERKGRLLKAMIFGRILFPSSKLALREEAGGTLLAKVCGLEEKDLEEDDLYRAMDGLNGVWSGIEKKLYREAQPEGASLVLYDLRVSTSRGRPRGIGAVRLQPGSPARSAAGASCGRHRCPGIRSMWRSCGEPGGQHDADGALGDSQTPTRDPRGYLRLRWRDEEPVESGDAHRHGA